MLVIFAAPAFQPPRVTIDEAFTRCDVCFFCVSFISNCVCIPVHLFVLVGANAQPPTPPPFPFVATCATGGDMNVHSIRRSPSHILNVCARHHMPHPAVGRPKTKTKKFTIHALRELAPFARVVTVDGGRRACLPCLIVSCAGAYAIKALAHSQIDFHVRHVHGHHSKELSKGLAAYSHLHIFPRFALSSVNFLSQLDYTRTVRTRIVVHRNSRRGSGTQRTVGAR
jgi:hypothetical protein